MDIQQSILHALHAIEHEHGVHILYACESGSRAWGIESHNSDYDGRFLYVHPKDDYLRLDVPRDVIECPMVDELDISGWDIFKALRLLRKSNPPLLEWLFSPVVYLEEHPFIERLRAIGTQYYSPVAVFHHYRQMAKGNYQQYIAGKLEVPTKKYLYVLRPLVALLYLEQRQLVPPTNFLTTLAQVDLSPQVYVHLLALIGRKRAGEELGRGPCDDVLNTWIEAHLEQWNTPFVEHQPSPEASRELEELLFTILNP